MYIDGVFDKINTTSGISNMVNSANLIAGKSACVNLSLNRHFTGLLDELEIFDRALIAEEIEDIFDAGSAGKCKPGADDDDDGDNG